MQVAQLRAESLPVGPVLLYPATGDVCVQFDQLVRALGFGLRIDHGAGWAVQGWYGTPEHLLQIEGMMVRNVAGVQALGAQDLRITTEGPCVTTQAFARWTGVRLQVDDTRTHLDVQSPWPLGIAARARAARRAQLVANAPLVVQSLPYAWWRAPTIDMTLETQVQPDAPPNSAPWGARYALDASGEAAHLSWRTRLSSNVRGAPLWWSVRALRYDSAATLLGPLHARQMMLGDVDARVSRLVNRSGSGRGAMVSNEDMDALQGFRRTELRGALQPGWDVELYRNGELVDYASDDGSGYFYFANVALAYGANDFEIRRYGPQGEQHSERRSFYMGQATVGAGQWRYWLGALQDGVNVVDALAPQRWQKQRGTWGKRHGMRATAALAYGLDQASDIMLQWHHLDVGARGQDFAEATLRHAGARANVEAGMAYGQGLVGQIAWMTALGESQVQGAYVRSDGHFVSDMIAADLRQRIDMSWEKNLALGALQLPLRLGVEQSQWHDAPARWGATAQVAAGWSRINLTQSLQAQHLGHGVAQPLLAITRVHLRMGAWRLRGEARYHVRGARAVQSLAAVADWALSPNSSLRWEVQQDMGLARAQAQARVDYSRRFQSISLGGYGARDRQGGWTLGLTLSTSIGPDAQKWGALHATPHSAQAVARVHVCEDANANHICEPEEAPVADVAIGNAQGARALSDPQGVALLDALPAWQMQGLRWDKSYTPDLPLRAPPEDIYVRGRPGVALHVDFPLAPVGRIIGQILDADGHVRVGMMLRLRDAQGQIQAHVQSNVDGGFEVGDLALGCYALELAPEEAARLAVPAHLRDHLCLTAEARLLPLGAVRLARMEMVAPSGRSAQKKGEEIVHAPNTPRH